MHRLDFMTTSEVTSVVISKAVGRSYDEMPSISHCGTGDYCTNVAY